MTKPRPMQLATLALLVGGLAAPPLLAQGKTFTVGVPLPLTGRRGEVRRDGEAGLRDGRRGDQRQGRREGRQARPRHPGLRRQARDRHRDRREVHRDEQVPDRRRRVHEPVLVRRRRRRREVQGALSRRHGRGRQDHPAGLEVRLPPEPAREPLQHGRLRVLREGRQAQVDRDPLREHRLRELDLARR